MYWTALDCTALPCTPLHSSALPCTALHNIVMHFTVLQYSLLHWNLLHCKTQIYYVKHLLFCSSFHSAISSTLTEWLWPWIQCSSLDNTGLHCTSLYIAENWSALNTLLYPTLHWHALHCYVLNCFGLHRNTFSFNWIGPRHGVQQRTTLNWAELFAGGSVINGANTSSLVVY